MRSEERRSASVAAIAESGEARGSKSVDEGARTRCFWASFRASQMRLTEAPDERVAKDQDKDKNRENAIEREYRSSENVTEGPASPRPQEKADSSDPPPAGHRNDK